MISRDVILMGNYKPAKVLCRKCIEEDISAEQLAEYLDGYVASLPEDIRASAEEYERRLVICGACEKRIALTCTLCGCYIQARAAKKKLECPYDIGGPKWRAEE